MLQPWRALGNRSFFASPNIPGAFQLVMELPKNFVGWPNFYGKIPSKKMEDDSGYPHDETETTTLFIFPGDDFWNSHGTMTWLRWSLPASSQLLHGMFPVSFIHHPMPDPNHLSRFSWRWGILEPWTLWDFADLVRFRWGRGTSAKLRSNRKKHRDAIN